MARNTRSGSGTARPRTRGVPGSARQSAEPRPAHRPQPAGDPRWLQGLHKAVRATFGDAALVQRCQVHKTRNILEYLQRSTAALGAGHPAARVSGPDLKTAAAAAAGSRAAARGRVSQRRRERAGRARGDAHGADAQSLAASAALAGDHQCGRESASAALDTSSATSSAGVAGR